MELGWQSIHQQGKDCSPKCQALFQRSLQPKQQFHLQKPYGQIEHSVQSCRKPALLTGVGCCGPALPLQVLSLGNGLGLGLWDPAYTVSSEHRVWSSCYAVGLMPLVKVTFSSSGVTGCRRRVPTLPWCWGENEGRGICWCRFVLLPEQILHSAEHAWGYVKTRPESQPWAQRRWSHGLVWLSIWRWVRDAHTDK